MPRLRRAHASHARQSYEHPPGTPLAVLELLDASELVWLVEAALPRPDLVGDSEYEVFELPATDIVFEEGADVAITGADEEALRSAEESLGSDLIVVPKARIAPRELAVGCT